MGKFSYLVTIRDAYSLGEVSFPFGNIFSIVARRLMGRLMERASIKAPMETRTIITAQIHRLTHRLWYRGAKITEVGIPIIRDQGAIVSPT
jgi:hypothetical protein